MLLFYRLFIILYLRKTQWNRVERTSKNILKAVDSLPPLSSIGSLI
jgi:hypothetical protein